MPRQNADPARPSPEEFLRRLAAEERELSRGRLKVFLGYASGVGKSARMLDEGRRRKVRGQDVVVAATQASESAQVGELLRGFEIVPALESTEGSAIDVEAVVRRRPEVVLVDGLAYRNPSGSRHAERWQDVDDILSAGVSVVASVNLQFVAERQEQVAAIIGRTVRDAVPEAFLRTADEIEIVDAPPEYCLNVFGGRSLPGAELARRERQLSELRELALLLAAEVVDQQLAAYLRGAGIEHVYDTHERILVCITPRSGAELMIRRGRRQADRFHGELFVVHARQPRLDVTDQAALEKNLRLARESGARVEVLEGGDPVRAILAFARRHGITQIFLGYAAGVGKTFRMLEEAQQLRREGRDVVVGYFEPHGRQDTIAKLEDLELVPRRRIEYRGHMFEEMDTSAIVARRPELCAVDEFPHTNVPGSPRAKRWEDVLALREAGIGVLTTMNVQHLESLNDQLHEITGVRVRETIPDWVVDEADEVVLIDLPPRALLNRLQRGVVYPPEKVSRALESFFKEPTLAALRELALRQTAHEVDVRHDVPSRPAAGIGDGTATGPEPRERILILVTDSPATPALIRRGRRVADYLRGDCFAVSVAPRPGARGPSTAGVDRHLEFARRLRIETRALEADDVALALVEFARRNAVTQVFLPRPPRRLLSLLGRRHTTMRVVALAHDMQLTVVADRRKVD